jgi:indolepyruvate ferredoxin oxidoreductase beta subunit
MKEFNTVITGVGGQGVVTLANIIAEAALLAGYDVKTSELHGLAQRGGSIPCHVRFGDVIYSPLVLEGEANLVIGLEPLEALRACYYGSKEHKTVFLIDNYRIVPLSVPILKEKYPSMEEVIDTLKDFSAKVIVLNASDAVKKETGSTVTTNIYLLGYASSKSLIPLEKKFFIEAIEETVPERYIEMNKKIFELGARFKS